MRAKQIATSVAAAFALGYGASATALVSAPGAVAEAFWSTTNFRVCAGNGAGDGGTATSCDTAAAPVWAGAVGSSPLLSGNGLSFTGGGLPGLVGNEELGATARVNGTSVSNNPPPLPLAFTAEVSASVNAAGFFTPGVAIPAVAPQGQYAAGISTGSGFALSPGGATVLLHSATEINSLGSDGSSSSEQTLSSTFAFGLSTAQTFELSLDGLLKRRAGIGQTGGDPLTNFANSGSSLSFTVDGVSAIDGSAIHCTWSPDGILGSGISCTGTGSSATEFADAHTFQTATGISVFAFDFNIPTTSGYFEAEFTLPAGFYSFTIAGTTQANAAVPTPEPHTLALLGLGLLGLGYAARRKPRA